MTAKKVNQAWSNLWVPLLIILLGGAAKVLDLIDANQFIAVLNICVLMFILLAVIGLVIYLTQKKKAN